MELDSTSRGGSGGGFGLFGADTFINNSHYHNATNDFIDFDVGLTLQMTETTDLYRDQHTAWSYPLVIPVKMPDRKYFTKIVSDAHMYNSDRYKYGSNAAYAA